MSKTHTPYYPPPDTSILSPRMGFDDLGNLVVAYQVNPGDRATTYLQKLDQDGDRMWGEKGTPQLPRDGRRYPW